jgi:hypothetical protein
MREQVQREAFEKLVSRLKNEGKVRLMIKESDLPAEPAAPAAGGPGGGAPHAGPMGAPHGAMPPKGAGGAGH